ncbi:MAG TPA: hypothetical protein VF244_08060 [Acidimicrobiales bacterium]
MDSFGVTPVPIGDENIVNFNVPPIVYAGSTYTRIGVDANGYLVMGGGTGADNNCCNLPNGPSPASPNNILAPLWTDLDGTGAPGVFAAAITNGVNQYVVVEWRVNVFGTTSLRTFQVWMGTNGVEDITFAYSSPPAAPGNQSFLVGAENSLGQGDMKKVLPTTDLRVTSTRPPAAENRSGDITGPVVVAGGKNVVITNARVVGPITVQPGGALTITNSSVTRGITANNPAFLSLCGVQVAGPSAGVALSVTGAGVPIQVGDPGAGCAGNRFAGDVNLTGNAGVMFGGNTLSRNATINGGGPGATVIKANNVFGTLACSGNSPAPTNSSSLNTAGSKTGQCASL